LGALRGARPGRLFRFWVRACTNGSAEDKDRHVTPGDKQQGWMARKQRYLAHLLSSDDDALLVSACDKLHNARAIVQDLEHWSVPTGSLFDRFTGGRDDTLRYYHSLAEIFSDRAVRVAPVLAGVVAKMHDLAGCSKSREQVVRSSERAEQD
jgi:hypothetical protein